MITRIQAFVLHLLLALRQLAGAFVVSPPQAFSLRSVMTHHPLSATDDSEWYSPPSPEPPISIPPLPAVPRGAKPVIRELESCLELDEFLDDSNKKLSIVLFHASWCKSCQKVRESYKRLANGQADAVDSSKKVVREGRLNLAALEWGKHEKLCRSLGIERLPTVYFYHEGQKVDGFSCGPKNFAERVPSTIRQLLFQIQLDQGSKLIEDVIGDLATSVQQQKTKRVSQL